MQKIDWKFLIITIIVCLLPIIFGVSVYEKLPSEVAIHWDFNNQPNSFASKSFFVFGVPILMVVFQIFMCVIYDIKSKVKEKVSIFEKIVKSIIPLITVVLYVVTILWSLGTELDMRKIACFLVGAIIAVAGIYTPELEYEEERKLQKSLFLKNAEVWDKVKKPLAYLYTLSGILMLVSIFFEPLYSLIAIGFFGVAVIVIYVWSIYLSLKK